MPTCITQDGGIKSEKKNTNDVGGGGGVRSGRLVFAAVEINLFLREREKSSGASAHPVSLSTASQSMVCESGTVVVVVAERRRLMSILQQRRRRRRTHSVCVLQREALWKLNDGCHRFQLKCDWILFSS